MHTGKEDHQLSKQAAGLDAGQVIRWKSWHRWTAVCLLAYLYLAVAVALQRQHDAARAWTSPNLGRAGNITRRVKVHDDPAAALSAYPRPVRQLPVAGLGHDQPTLLITNRPQLPARHVIQSYAKRMNIEQRLAEAIQSFGLDALAGAVPLNVDLDVVLSVLAHTICAALRRRLPGYHAATPDTLQRRFLNTGGIILNRSTEIVVRLNRRTYSPVLRQASLPQTITVPWWGGRTLRYEYA